MAQVKGTLLIDFVKTVKADKSGAYDAYLTDQDRKIISEHILPSAWYPFETFKNCFNASVMVLAKGDMETVREWGRLYGEAIITSVYKGLIKGGSPLESLKKYGIYIRNFFDFGEILIEAVSENEAIVTIKEMDNDFEPLYHMVKGWIERSLEMCGAKNISVEFISKSWEGKPETSIKYSWDA